MSLLSGRRPVVMLFVSLLIFGAALIGRGAGGPGPGAAGGEPGPAAAKALELGDQETVVRLQERLRLDPEDTDSYALLGLALLQRVRETADASLYAQAGQAFAEALKRDPNQLDALAGQGLLALSRHRFREALAWGERARAIDPTRAQLYGIIGDAQVELGRYEAAAATVQKMVDTRPELASYSRVSYLRELFGDTAGAITAMQMAVNSGVPGHENTLWAQVQLGHLYFNSGNLRLAEETYRRALQYRPDYAYALAGLARVAGAQGRYDEAIEFYREIVERLPLPEFVISLGELYEVTGQPAEARNQYDLVRAIQQLNAGAGVDVELELALFDLDHGADPGQLLQKVRSSYERRPTIYAADSLAWALYRNGDYAEARRYSQEALRLDTRDAMLHYHAGMIAHALRDTAAARRHLRQALSINPAFSIRYAPQAQALLTKLENVDR